MSEENNFEKNENLNNQQNENVENVEEVVNDTETANETNTNGENVANAENLEGQETTASDNAEETPEVADIDETKDKKKLSAGVIAGIAAAVVVIIAAVLFVIFKNTWFNPYTKDYIDIDGVTIGEVADQNGMEYKDFLEFYGIPSDMPKSTPQHAAINSIPVGKYAEMMIGTDFATLASQMGWGEEITEETTLGDALDQTTLGNFTGEMFEEFKSQYGLGDEITEDTLYKEVRNIVDMKEKELYDAQKAGVEPTEAVEEISDDEASQEAVTTEEAATEAAAQ